MEPVTHALASLALARAGLDRITRRATPLLIIAGLAPDADYASLAGGPRAFLTYHRSVTHSLVGAGTIAALLAALFWRFDRTHATSPLRFRRLLVVSVIGVGAHLLLDLCNSHGEKLLWPFRAKWYAWDLVQWFDPWLLLLFAAGLLLPGLFRLISEEIGARPARRANRGAVAALLLVALYCGGRYALHARALEMLASRVYHGGVPLAVGAFPEAASPLEWRGVVDTANTVEQLDVSLEPGSYFDPDRSRTFYKPEPSPALDVARATRKAQLLLEFARFPLANVERIEDGYRVTLRDLRDSSETAGLRNPVGVVKLDRQFRVTREELRFGLPPYTD